MDDLTVNTSTFQADGEWRNVDDTCIQLMAYPFDWVGMFRVRHDPQCQRVCHDVAIVRNPGGPVNPVPYVPRPSTQYTVERVGFARYQVRRQFHLKGRDGWDRYENVIATFLTRWGAERYVKGAL